MAKVSQTLRQSATDSASSSSSETNRAQATEPNQHVHSPDALVELKSARGFEHARKMTRKASALAEKKALKDPLVYWDLLLHKDYRDTRSVRPHMTMHVRGGWQLQLDDDGRSALEEETDWVAEVDDAPAAREVPLVDLLKPAKRRKTRRHRECFIPNATLLADGMMLRRRLQSGTSRWFQAPGR